MMAVMREQTRICMMNIWKNLNFHAYGNTKWYTLVENTMEVALKIKYWVTMWPRDPTYRFIQTRMNKINNVYPKTCTWMFIKVLFLILKKLSSTTWWRSRWTWSTSPSMDTWGIHIQTQKCSQNTSWEQTEVHDQRKRIYGTTQNLVGWRN